MGIPRRLWQGMACCLAIVLLCLCSGPGAERRRRRRRPAAKTGPRSRSADSTDKDDASQRYLPPTESGRGKGGRGAEPAPATPADPSQTRKIAPNEVFRDPKAGGFAQRRQVFRSSTRDKTGSHGRRDRDREGDGRGPECQPRQGTCIDRVIDASDRQVDGPCQYRGGPLPPRNDQSTDGPGHSRCHERICWIRFSRRRPNPRNEAFLTAYNRSLVIEAQTAAQEPSSSRASRP